MEFPYIVPTIGYIILTIKLEFLLPHRDYFRKPLNDHIDPDVTVAYGAASILD